MKTIPVRIREDAYKRMQESRGEIDVIEFLSSALIAVANDPSLIGSKLPVVKLPDEMEALRKENLQLKNELLRITIEARKNSIPRVVKDKLAIAESTRNGVETIGEPRTRKEWTAVSGWRDLPAEKARMQFVECKTEKMSVSLETVRICLELGHEVVDAAGVPIKA